MRKEVWRSKGIFRNRDYAKWRKGEPENIADGAHARLREILKDGIPPSRYCRTRWSGLCVN